ncbi:unnamed protein product [Gadus morhua 'NCC']
MVPSMGRRGADGCSVAAQPAPHLLPDCEAAVVGKAQCEWEPGLMAGSQELSEEEEEDSGVGAEGGGGGGRAGARKLSWGGGVGVGEGIGRAWILSTARESQSSLSHPFEIQVQGHEPREEWQHGPAPGQTGSHRTGPRSSSPGPYPPQPTPRLARAYGSQSADPQWTGRGPTLQGPIPGPPLVSGAPSEQGFSGMGPSGVCC